MVRIVPYGLVEVLHGFLRATIKTQLPGICVYRSVIFFKVKLL